MEASSSQDEFNAKIREGRVGVRAWRLMSCRQNIDYDVNYSRRGLTSGTINLQHTPVIPARQLCIM